MGSDACVDVAEWQNDIFQSTLPAWGATKKHTIISEIETISIHAPAWGATLRQQAVSFTIYSFQSTPPHGERPLILL